MTYELFRQGSYYIYNHSGLKLKSSKRQPSDEVVGERAGLIDQGPFIFYLQGL